MKVDGKFLHFESDQLEYCRKNFRNFRNLKKKMPDTPDNVSLIAFA